MSDWSWLSSFLATDDCLCVTVFPYLWYRANDNDSYKQCHKFRHNCWHYTATNLETKHYLFVPIFQNIFITNDYWDIFEGPRLDKGCQNSKYLWRICVIYYLKWNQNDVNRYLIDFGCQLTWISGSSGFSSPICWSLSRAASHNLWYLRLNKSSSCVTFSLPDTRPSSSWRRGTLPSRLGCSSSSSHWNFSKRRS